MLRCLRAAAKPIASLGSLWHQHRFGSGRYKVVSAEDAVFLVQDGAVITVGGFVGQNSPEELLLALGERYKDTKQPKDLTLIFTGGPGDWQTRGLNHLAQKGLLKRAIGSHYGQTPMLAEMAMSGEIEAYNLPLGNIIRMIRCAAAGQPGHLSRIGLGTFVDPRFSGGKINSRTTEDLVRLMEVDGEQFMFFKAIPIDVALTRGTTADPDGNVTMERESLYVDNKLMAMAAHSTRGLSVVQVESIAAAGTLSSRNVIIPGTMVDCVVQARPENHWMSYATPSNRAATGEVRFPTTFAKMPLNDRKIIARRGVLELIPGQIVNLGVGMPEGVAAVADEEQVLQFIELTTEPGIHGGVGLTGHDFGPAANYDALIEMNQQFDFYNGGGLDTCFLGMAEVSEKGDVNVTRVGPKLTGPGGFIDISQATKRVNLLGTFTTGGLKVEAKNGALTILQEGRQKKFVKEIPEITFSADTAKKQSQVVHYITERCVFSLTTQGLELVEIAPGIDVEKHILPNMEFVPLIREPLKKMDSAIYRPELMKLRRKTFGLNFDERFYYRPNKNLVYVNLSNLSVQTPEDIEEVRKAISDYIVSHAPQGKAHVVGNYERFDVHPDLSQEWTEMAQSLQKNYYLSVRRVTGRVFARHKLADSLRMSNVEMTLSDVRRAVRKLGFMIADDALELMFNKFDDDKTGTLDVVEQERLFNKLKKGL